MNERTKEFITNMGLLCETWIIAYRSFKNHGMKKKEALKHTKEFMAMVLADIRRHNKEVQK